VLSSFEIREGLAAIFLMFETFFAEHLEHYNCDPQQVQVCIENPVSFENW
jgi:hypothetical protein